MVVVEIQRLQYQIYKSPKARPPCPMCRMEIYTCQRWRNRHIINSIVVFNFSYNKRRAKNARRIFYWPHYAILAAARVRRETLREARFFGIVLPAAFIILLSALRTATTAAARASTVTTAAVRASTATTAARVPLRPQRPQHPRKEATRNASAEKSQVPPRPARSYEEQGHERQLHRLR